MKRLLRILLYRSITLIPLAIILLMAYFLAPALAEGRDRAPVQEPTCKDRTPTALAVLVAASVPSAAPTRYFIDRTNSPL